MTVDCVKMELKLNVQKKAAIKKLMAEYFLFSTALDLVASRAKWATDLFAALYRLTFLPNFHLLQQVLVGVFIAGLLYDFGKCELQHILSYLPSRIYMSMSLQKID